MPKLEYLMFTNYIIIKYNSETYRVNMGVFSMLNMMRHNNMMEEQKRRHRRMRELFTKRRKENNNEEE